MATFSQNMFFLNFSASTKLLSKKTLEQLDFDFF